MVSVVLPFYDPPLTFFRQAIDSVLQQTYRDWELILVNDGSSEDATVVAHEYCDRHPDRIRLVAHPDEKNFGLYASRRLGFQHASFAYVALLDADDLWLPNKLAEQIALLDENPGVGLVYGNSLYWRSWAGEGGQDFEPDLGVTTARRVDPPSLVPLFLSGRIAVPCPSSMVAHRSAITAAGGFDGEFQNMYEDQVFLAKMCFQSTVLIYPRTWDYHRLHEGAMTASTSDDSMVAARFVFLRWMNRYMDECGLDDKDVRDTIAKELWKLEHPRRARIGQFFRKRLRRKTQLRFGTSL